MLASTPASTSSMRRGFVFGGMDLGDADSAARCTGSSCIAFSIVSASAAFDHADQYARYFICETPVRRDVVKPPPPPPKVPLRRVVWAVTISRTT